MKKQSLMSKIATLAVVGAVAIGSSRSAVLASNPANERLVIGSVYTVMEIGYNENTGYAFVDAYDYLDGSMSGHVKYVCMGQTYPSTFNKYIDQRCYAEVSKTVDHNITYMECTFDLCSYDGELNHTLTTN